MQYLLLIYDNETQMAARKAGHKAKVDEYRTFTQSIIQSGNFKRRRRAAADRDRYDGESARREGDDSERSIRGNAQTAWRLLSRRGPAISIRRLASRPAFLRRRPRSPTTGDKNHQDEHTS